MNPTLFTNFPGTIMARPQSQQSAGKISAGALSDISSLIIAAGGVLLAYLAMTGSIWLAIWLTAAIAIGFPNQMRSLYKYLMWKMNPSNGVFQLIAVIAIFSTFLVISAANPAHAQFFTQTETWMTGNLFSGVANAAAITALVFNVLRGIFVIYLGVSLVRVIVAARNDDDWTTLARTPLIVLVAVTLGDVIGNFITGAGTGTGGGGGGAAAGG
jgi:hypothetical protein